MKHVDTNNPQIGLLYLRYVGNPKQLWEWFLKYIRDPEVCSTNTCHHALLTAVAGVSTQWPGAENDHHRSVCTRHSA